MGNLQKTRGPNGQGISTNGQPPVQFGPDQDVISFTKPVLMAIRSGAKDDATPALAEGTILLRTAGNLYAFGQRSRMN